MLVYQGVTKITGIWAKDSKPTYHLTAQDVIGGNAVLRACASGRLLESAVLVGKQ